MEQDSSTLLSPQRGRGSLAPRPKTSGKKRGKRTCDCASSASRLASGMTFTIAQTFWTANPAWYDYTHLLGFDDDIGFVCQGDGQAMKWASFFSYTLVGNSLEIEFLPTFGDVGNTAPDSLNVKIARTPGTRSVRTDMGVLLEFSETMTVSRSIVSYEPKSLTYFRAGDRRDFKELTRGYSREPS